MQPASEPPSLIPPRRAPLVFIYITVVLDMLALGIVIPIFPELIREFLGGDTQRAAELYGLFNTVWALMQFTCSPLLGALSDRFGRRRVILISNFGLGLDYILMALAPSLSWLFVGRVISGITSAGHTTAAAYIADVTPPERRAAAFGMLGASFGLGFVMGPALGGLLGGIDPRLPFWVAAVLTLVNSAYGLFVLPESLPPERRRAFSLRRANPVGSLKLLRSHPELLGLSAVNMLNNLAHESLPSVYVLYTVYRYAWSEQWVGISLAVIGVASMIVQGGLVRHVVRAIGERRAALLGLVFGSLGFAIFGLSPTGMWFLLGIPIFCLWGFYGPAAQGLMTRHVGPSEQGELQGAINSLRGIAGMLGPVVFTLIFAWAIDAHRTVQVPGAPFLLGACLLAVAGPLAWWVTRHTPEHQPAMTSVPVEHA
jgi:DHA1 family tetracycline resistance protein-like MFS transporter